MSHFSTRMAADMIDAFIVAWMFFLMGLGVWVATWREKK